MALVKLASADEIPDGGMIGKEHQGKQIVLVKIQDAIYAMDNICTHQGAELHEGDLGEEGTYYLTCPWHAAHFDVRTGKVHQETDWATDLGVYQVEVKDGEVFVDL